MLPNHLLRTHRAMTRTLFGNKNRQDRNPNPHRTTYFLKTAPHDFPIIWHRSQPTKLQPAIISFSTVPVCSYCCVESLQGIDIWLHGIQFIQASNINLLLMRCTQVISCQLGFTSCNILWIYGLFCWYWYSQSPIFPMIICSVFNWWFRRSLIV